MSTLQLDKTDGGVAAMVEPWKVGGEYELRVKVRQTGVSEDTATFDVIEATDETAETPEEAEEPAPEAEYTPPPAKSAKSGKPSLTIK